MNILLVIILVFILFSLILGIRRGFIKNLTVLGSSVVAIIVTFLLLGTVTQFVDANLNLTEYFAQKFRVKVESSLPEGFTTEMGELPLLAQASVIEGMPFPQTLKDKITENNHTSMYELLGVSGFVEYLTHYIAGCLVRIICFFVLFLVVFLVLRLIFGNLTHVSTLPIINGIDSLLGGVLGLGVALVVIWLFFLILTLFCTTALGQMSFAMIGQSRLLSWLYDNNILLNFLTALR